MDPALTLQPRHTMALSQLLHVLFAAAAAAASGTDSATTINWTIEPSAAAAMTSSSLVSFNLDWHPPDEGPTWGENASVVTIDLQNPRLKKLAKAMSPAFLRIGGSEGDDAVYDIDGACKKSRGGSGVPDPASDRVTPMHPATATQLLLLSCCCCCC